MAFSTTDTEIVYTGNGSDTTFNIPFSFNGDTTIFAELYDITTTPFTLITPFVRGSEWDVVGNDVVLGTAPTADQQVLIFRDSPSTHLTLYNTLEFPFETANNDFDDAFRKIQEIEQNLLRAILEDRINVANGATPPSGGQITQNQTDIATNVTNISNNATAITNEATTRAAADSALDTRVTALESTPPGADPQIAINTTNIATNATNISSNDTDIANNATAIAANATAIATNATNISSNDTDISGLDTRVSALEALPPGGGISYTAVLANTNSATVNAVNNNVIIVRANDVTVTLPATPANNSLIKVKLRTGNQVTINGNGETIDGNATEILNSPNGVVELFYDSSEWVII